MNFKLWIIHKVTDQITHSQTFSHTFSLTTINRILNTWYKTFLIIIRIFEKHYIYRVSITNTELRQVFAITDNKALVPIFNTTLILLLLFILLFNLYSSIFNTLTKASENKTGDVTCFTKCFTLILYSIGITTLLTMYANGILNDCWWIYIDSK